MCVYTRSIFSCTHHVWGRRVRRCNTAQDHALGKLPFGCRTRKPHGLMSRKVQGKCNKCKRMDNKLKRAKVGVEYCRRTLRNMGLLEEGKGGEEQERGAEVEVGCNDEGEVGDAIGEKQLWTEGGVLFEKVHGNEID